MRIVAIALGLILLGMFGVLGWQHLRYVKARRVACQDLQPLLHAAGVFHVLDFLRVQPGSDVLEQVRKLRDALETDGRAQVVYAGKTAFVGLHSSQLGEISWDAVLLTQYTSRAAYDAVAASPEHERAFAAFAETYSHGLQRNPLLNLGLPAILLGARAVEVLTGVPSHYPFVPAETDAEREESLRRFEAFRELGRDAVVIVNLLKHGTPEQRAADAEYGRKMLGLMAEGGHGPMHMGSAVTLEGDATFDRVAIVYYPGVDYVKALFQSAFFQGIVGGKQPGDTQAVVTVPILSRL